MIRYYFFIDTYPKSPNYMKPMSLHRMRIDESGAYPERWNGKEWEANNGLIAFTGIGGESDYYKTTELEAMHFLSLHTKGGSGSGNFGHEGRPGEVGGSGGGGGNSTTTYAETESKPSTDLQPMLDATMPDTRPYKGGYPAEGFKTTDEINEYMRAQPYANGGSLTPKEYISNLQGDPRMANEIAAEVAYMYSGQSGVGRLEVGEGLRLQGYPQGNRGTLMSGGAWTSWGEKTALGPQLNQNTDVNAGRLAAASELWENQIRVDGAPFNTAGYFPQDQQVSAMVDHEIGHMTYEMSLRGSEKSSWTRLYNGTPIGHMDDIPRVAGTRMSVSTYAARFADKAQAKEGFAEAYSLYVNNMGDKLPEKWNAYFDKLGVGTKK